MTTITTGQLGQSQAESYLVLMGYKIVETNFRTKMGEIDIIAKENEQLVFVEVKYRRSANFGSGFEAVNRKKLAKISLVADQYLKLKKIRPSCRIDVVSIDGVKIRIFKNVLPI